MRNLRAIVMPLLFLIGLCALAMWDVNLTGIAHFGFIWDVLLGAAIGIALVLLPEASGFSVKRNALTAMYWASGFITLLLIFYQYMANVTGLHVQSLTFIASPGTRMRIVEGVIFGYCSFVAGRGRL